MYWLCGCGGCALMCVRALSLCNMLGSRSVSGDSCQHEPVCIQSLQLLPTQQANKGRMQSAVEHTHIILLAPPQPLPGIIQITLLVHFERTPTLPLTLLILRKRQVYLYLGHFSLNQKNTQMIFELLISMAFIHIHVHYIWILEVTLSHVFFNFSRILDQE